jgi:hypothetical protein
MNVAMPKVHRGVALAKENVGAADVANNQDGRTSRAELKQILDGEGYGKGDPMRRGTMAFFEKARKLAGGKAPTAKDLASAAKQADQAIARAAGKDGRLSDRELKSLSTADRFVARFADRFGNDTLDEHFF